MKVLDFIHQRTYPIALFGIFTIAHGVFYYFGGRFDPWTLNFWQIIDSELLRDRLWESLWYFHIQPPLFNAYLGLIHKIPISDHTWIFYISFLSSSLTATYMLFYLICRFRVHPGIALGVVGFCLIFPSWILYEHWLFYEFPTMALSILAIFLIQNYLHKPATKNSFFAFSALASLFFLRPIFPWAWYAASILLVFAAIPNNGKSLIKGAIVPTIFILLFLLKNYLVFGICSTSTWLGPNLLAMTHNTPFYANNRPPLGGTYSPVLPVKPFANLDEFEPWIPDVLRQTWGVPVLDRTQRSDGTNNYNHGAYLVINRYQFQDAVTLIVRFPRKYWNKVCESYRRFCYPAWNNKFFFGLPSSLDPWLAIWNRLFLGWNQQEMDINFDEMQFHPKKGFLCLFFPIFLVISFTLVAFPTWITGLNRSERFLLVFCFMNTFLILFAGTCLLATENNRIRFLSTPYTAIFLALLIDRYVKPIAQRFLCVRRT